MKKILLTLVALLTLGGMLKAETLTLDFTQNNYGMTPTNDGNGDYNPEPCTLTGTDPLTVTLGGHSRLWIANSGNELRAYKVTDQNTVATTITIAAPEGKVITEITLTGNAANDYKVASTAVAGTWKGSLASVILTYSNTSKNNGLQTIVITYGDGTEQPVEPTEPEEPDQPEEPGDDTDTVVWVAADDTSHPANGEEWTSGEIDAYTGWTATAGSNPPKYYNAGSGLRVYNGGTFTITSVKDMAKITLTFAGDTYTFESGQSNPLTVEPKATTYKWDVKQTCRLQKVEITYVEGAQPVVKGDAALAFTSASATVNIGETATVEFTKATSAEVTFTNSDPEVATYDASTGVITPLAQGTTTITATSPENSEYKSGEATLKIVVVDPTAEKPTQVVWVAADAEHPANAGNWPSGDIDINTTWSATDGTNPAKWYDSGEALRVYNGGTYTLRSTRVLDKVVLTFDGVDTDTPSKYTFTADMQNPATFTPKATTYTWAVSQNSRLQKVEIFYGEDGGDTPEPTNAYATIKEWIDAKPATSAKINAPVTAVYQNGKDLYVTAGDQWLLVYGALTQKYTNGDLIPAGISGVYDNYNGQVQMKPEDETFTAATTGTPVRPVVLPLAAVSDIANLSRYVTVENVTLTADANNAKLFVAESEGVQLKVFNRWSIADLKEGVATELTGFVTYYQKGDEAYFELLPTAVKDGQQTPDTPDLPVEPGQKSASFNFMDLSTLTTSTEIVAPTLDANGTDVNGVTFTAGNVQMINDQATNTQNGPVLWLTQDGATQLRVYAGNTTTFNVVGDEVSRADVAPTLTAIRYEMTTGATDYISAASEGTVSYDTDAKLVTWTGNAQNVVLTWQKGTGSAKPQINSVKVVYTGTTGIEQTVVLVNDPVEYYNLQGMRIANPTVGQIVIRRQGNDIRKIVF